jgi:biopolymer transport protein ExbB/TolQ
MIAIHAEGGMPYMVPLTLMLLFNLVLIVIALIKKMQNKDRQFERLELIRQVGLLALAWGVLSTVIAFFQAFGDLARSGDTIPFNVIMGGLRVALITALYGLIIFVVSLAGYLGLRFPEKNS